ncbi:MAG: ABC transporter ATP-binding protein [Deltaproteobacteria bacterium]|nr:ABC transporter ATP-binding protein [Deltaproteobacteria bacterium]
MTTDAPLLKVTDLSFSIGEKQILHNVSFDIKTGEWVSIVGPNGAGKSTLLKCLMRILKMDAGDVRFLGKAISHLSQKALATRIAYVPQSTGVVSPFSVREHVTLARYAHLKPLCGPQKRDMEVVESCIAEAGLSQLAGRSVSSLSGGERQRVYLAAAFAQEAQLLLLDEPNTFLDPKCSFDVLQLLQNANKNRETAILSVTHDINAAAVCSDTMLALRGGEIMYYGEATSFVQDAILQKVYEAPFSFVRHPETGQKLTLPWRLS